VTIRAAGTVCINQSGVCYSTIRAAVGNATAGQTVIITDNATYSESVTINKALTLTSNGTSFPTILGNNTTALTTAGNLVNISKVNLSLIGTADSINAISGYNFRLTDAVVWWNTTGNLGVVSPQSGGTVVIDRVNFTGNMSAGGNAGAIHWRYGLCDLYGQ
jgi:hypothetical protein